VAPVPPLPQRALDHGCSRRLGVAARSGIVGRSGVRAFRLEPSPQSCDHGRRALYAPLLLRLQHRIALGVRARHALPAFAARVLRAAARQVALGRVGGVAVNEIILEVFLRGRDTTGEEGGVRPALAERAPHAVDPVAGSTGARAGCAHANPVAIYWVFFIYPPLPSLLDW